MSDFVRTLISCGLTKHAFGSFEGTAIKESQYLVGGHKPRSTQPQLVKNFAPLFLIERLDRVVHDADAEAAAQQAVGGAKHAVFGDHAEHEKIRAAKGTCARLPIAAACIRGLPRGTRRAHVDASEQSASVRIVEDIEGVFFQNHLLIRAQITW